MSVRVSTSGVHYARKRISRWPFRQVYGNTAPRVARTKIEGSVGGGERRAESGDGQARCMMHLLRSPSCHIHEPAAASETARCTNAVGAGASESKSGGGSGLAGVGKEADGGDIWQRRWP